MEKWGGSLQVALLYDSKVKDKPCQCYSTSKMQVKVLQFHFHLSFSGDSYERFAVITDLQWSTCIQEWSIQLQKIESDVSRSGLFLLKYSRSRM